jgi:hypothetical protein
MYERHRRRWDAVKNDIKKDGEGIWTRLSSLTQTEPMVACFE